MQNALPDAGDHLVTIRDDNWRLGDHHGRVCTTLPIASHPHFCELAVLVRRGCDDPHYAARATGTDTWVHFHYLQPWMHPLVRAFLENLETHDHVVELLEKAHQITHGNH